MGGRHSTSSERKSSLKPSERRRVLSLFESDHRHTDSFNFQEISNIWQDILVPDLINTYTRYFLRQGATNVCLEEFVSLYNALIRGDSETKAACIADLVSMPNSKSDVISFNNLCKYLSDVFQSYMKAARNLDDNVYNSWTHLRRPTRSNTELTVRGICNDLPKSNDNVNLEDLERFVNRSPLINSLHTHLLGYMYNLLPDELSSLIPLAILPNNRIQTLLDLSQVIFINSLIPIEMKTDWRFLFSTSVNGESFSKLVGCITNQGPLVLVIESDCGSKFGGFISENIQPGPRWVGTEDTFLFRLSPRTEVFFPTGYNKHYVYLNMGQTSLPNGLGIGGQHDYWGLFIDADEFGNGQCSETCSTFKHYNMLTAATAFTISDIEVWGVGDRPLTAREKGERAPSSILDKDAVASHLMEMSGRQMHSKGIRKESLN